MSFGPKNPTGGGNSSDENPEIGHRELNTGEILGNTSGDSFFGYPPSTTFTSLPNNSSEPTPFSIRPEDFVLTRGNIYEAMGVADPNKVRAIVVPLMQMFMQSGGENHSAEELGLSDSFRQQISREGWSNLEAYYFLISMGTPEHGFESLYFRLKNYRQKPVLNGVIENGVIINDDDLIDDELKESLLSIADVERVNLINFLSTSRRNLGRFYQERVLRKGYFFHILYPIEQLQYNLQYRFYEAAVASGCFYENFLTEKYNELQEFYEEYISPFELEVEQMKSENPVLETAFRMYTSLRTKFWVEAVENYRNFPINQEIERRTAELDEKARKQSKKLNPEEYNSVYENLPQQERFNSSVDIYEYIEQLFASWPTVSYEGKDGGELLKNMYNNIKRQTGKISVQESNQSQEAANRIADENRIKKSDERKLFKMCEYYIFTILEKYGLIPSQP